MAVCQSDWLVDSPLVFEFLCACALHLIAGARRVLLYALLSNAQLRAKRLLQASGDKRFALITAMLVSLPTGLTGDRQRLMCGKRGGPCALREHVRARRSQGQRGGVREADGRCSKGGCNDVAVDR